MADSGKSLFLMYSKAGPTVLAHRLKKIFRPILTTGDQALHNDALGEVLLIIENEERLFMKGMAKLILEIGQKKGR